MSIKKIVTNFILVAILWLSSFQIPTPAPPELDPSWQVILHDAHLKNTQFGKEIIFSYGPLGWCLTNNIIKENLIVKLVYEFIFKILICLLVIYGVRELKPFQKIIFIFLYSLTNIYFIDNFYNIFIFILFNFFIIKDVKTKTFSFVLVLLTILSLTKVTYLIYSCAFTFLAISYYLNDKKYIKIILLLVVPISSFLIFWNLCNQSFKNIIPFLFNSFIIIKNYSPAMSLTENTIVYYIGIISFIIILYILFKIFIKDILKFKNYPIYLFFILTLYLSWKHGFVRADNHLHAYFTLYPAIICLIPFIFSTNLKKGFLIIQLIISLIAISFYDNSGTKYFFINYYNSLYSKFTYIISIDKSFNKFNKELYALQKDDDINEIKTIIRDDSVDTINNDQALLINNEFNYRNRPIIQNYKSYSPELININYN